MSPDVRLLSDLGAHRHLVLSERIRERRRALDLTQKQVVSRLRKLGVETTNKALSSLEHGAGLDVAKLPELACALECTLTYLVGLTDRPDRWQPDPPRWPAASLPLARPAPEPPPPPQPDLASRGPRILGPIGADQHPVGGD